VFLVDGLLMRVTMRLDKVRVVARHGTLSSFAVVACAVLLSTTEVPAGQGIVVNLPPSCRGRHERAATPGGEMNALHAYTIHIKRERQARVHKKV